jgi:hypothetical protein
MAAAPPRRTPLCVALKALQRQQRACGGVLPPPVALLGDAGAGNGEEGGWGGAAAAGAEAEGLLEKVRCLHAYKYWLQQGPGVCCICVLKLSDSLLPCICLQASRIEGFVQHQRSRAAAIAGKGGQLQLARGLEEQR